MHVITDKREQSAMTGQSRIKFMRKLFLYLAGALTFIMGVSSTQAAEIRITRIYDGDTFTLSTGEIIRLLQVDAPELRGKECFAVEAQKSLAKLLNSKRNISFKTDPKLDRVDRYGRSLRYLFVGKTNVNLRLVEIGAATPYFYRGQKGDYSEKLLAAAKRAKSKKIGLWKICPETKLNPYKSASTGIGVIAPDKGPSELGKYKCDPNYRECVPVYPPDLNCSDISKMGFTSIHVVGRDVHQFDRDGDGIGCDK